MQRTESAFGRYADRLGSLLHALDGDERERAVLAALDGEAGRLLRSAVSLARRRDTGCFFTSGELAGRLLAKENVTRWAAIADPACGAGDLLLEVARRLPLREDVESTLSAWGEVLVGRDLDPALVRTTRLRLALLASARLKQRTSLDEDRVKVLLPEIAPGDGQELALRDPVLLLLNPPFGTVEQDTGWGQGRLGRAAVFSAAVGEQLPPGSRLLAILPDVLRSGSNYRRWRQHMASLMAIDGVELHGQFDAWTDVDVFLLRAMRQAAEQGARWPERVEHDGRRLGDLVHVSVGTVVPHRDPHRGAWSPYIEARDLPLGGRFDADGARRRRHPGRRFEPPFVAVRRTSRPGQDQPRALGVLIEGSRPVLVENHLLVCRPADTSVSCEALLQLLADSATTAWLDQRIRCRHLTVCALRELPISL